MKRPPNKLARISLLGALAALLAGGREAGQVHRRPTRRRCRSPLVVRRDGIAPNKLFT